MTNQQKTHTHKQILIGNNCHGLRYYNHVSDFELASLNKFKKQKEALPNKATHTNTDKHFQTHTDTDKHKQAETDAYRQTHKQTNRNADRTHRHNHTSLALFCFAMFSYVSIRLALFALEARWRRPVRCQPAVSSTDLRRRAFNSNIEKQTKTLPNNATPSKTLQTFANKFKILQNN